MLKINEKEFKKNRRVVEGGFKLNENMRSKIVESIENLNDPNKQDVLMWIIAGKCGFRKFKNFNYLKNHLDKLDEYLSNESAFESGLGLNLINFFNLKPKNMLIFEDIEGIGRVIKENNTDSEKSKIIFFIPTFKNDGSDSNYSIDSDIKYYNSLAEKEYDATEGLVYSL